MDRNVHPREAQLHAISEFSQSSERAQGVDVGTAELREGLTCTCERDGHWIALDMPEAIGGDDAGPPPGCFGRAAICGCLAIGIKMTAVRETLHLDAVRVGIEQDWHHRELLAMEGASHLPGNTRIAIEVTGH